MKKIVIICISIIIIAAAGLGYFYKDNIDRIAISTSLFSGAEQYENFNRVADIFPVTTMEAAPKAFNFAKGTSITLPASFTYKALNVEVDTFLSETDTSALLVIQDGKIRFEQYWLTGGRDVNWLSMSVAKSFVATAIGIAVDESLININKPITDYVPSLQGSAYDEVRIKDVLQMSSGAAWDEDYGDPESDVIRLGRIMAIGGSLDEFVATIKSSKPPGTLNHYNSADTQALGMLLSRATGQSVTQYINEKIWQPLGMESNGYWIVDDHDVEMVFAGLNATARDYAKLGELYRLKGDWQGQKIVSAQWIAAATTADAPHLLPDAKKEPPLGYGYQWWLPASTEGEFSAIGVYNQFIYVNPSRNLVIVKLSAYSDYASSNEDSAFREMESIEFFRAIGQQF